MLERGDERSCLHVRRYRRWLTAQQRDEKQQNIRRRLAHQHLSNSLCSLIRERDSTLCAYQVSTCMIVYSQHKHTSIIDMYYTVILVCTWDYISLVYYTRPVHNYQLCRLLFVMLRQIDNITGVLNCYTTRLSRSIIILKHTTDWTTSLSDKHIKKAVFTTLISYTIYNTEVCVCVCALVLAWWAETEGISTDFTDTHWLCELKLEDGNLVPCALLTE